MISEAETSNMKAAKVVHSPQSRLRSGKIREISESQPNLNAEGQTRTERDERFEILERKMEAIMTAMSELELRKSRDNSPKSVTSEEAGNTAKPRRVTRETGYSSDDNNAREANMQIATIGGMRFPRGGWIKSPFDELSLSDETTKSIRLDF